MSKRQVLMIIGLVIMVYLFLGFPSGFDWIFFLISGALVAGIAYTMAPREKVVEKRDVPFSEFRSEGTSVAQPSVRVLDSITKKNIPEQK